MLEERLALLDAFDMDVGRGFALITASAAASAASTAACIRVSTFDLFGYNFNFTGPIFVELTFKVPCDAAILKFLCLRYEFCLQRCVKAGTFNYVFEFRNCNITCLKVDKSVIHYFLGS